MILPLQQSELGSFDVDLTESFSVGLVVIIIHVVKLPNGHVGEIMHFLLLQDPAELVRVYNKILCLRRRIFVRIFRIILVNRFVIRPRNFIKIFVIPPRDSFQRTLHNLIRCARYLQCRLHVLVSLKHTNISHITNSVIRFYKQNMELPPLLKPIQNALVQTFPPFVTLWHSFFFFKYLFILFNS